MANVHWFNLASIFSDKSPTTDYTAWWAQKLHFAFDSYLQQESKMGLDYMFGTTSYSKDLVQVLLRDFILCIKRHKRDEFPMSFGVKFQIWLSFLCQAFEQHSLPGSHDTHSTVQILTVKQNFFKTTMNSAQEIYRSQTYSRASQFTFFGTCFLCLFGASFVQISYGKNSTFPSNFFKTCNSIELCKTSRA